MQAIQAIALIVVTASQKNILIVVGIVVVIALVVIGPMSNLRKSPPQDEGSPKGSVGGIEDADEDQDTQKRKP